MAFHIEDPRQIRALSSPARVGIVDGLEAGGAMTIAELGSVLGYPADGLYYHVRALERFGLVIRVDQDAKNGAARFDVPGRPVKLRYDLTDARRRNATTKLVSTILRRAERSFRRAYTPGRARLDGPNRNLRAGRRTAWLRPAELAALNRALETIHALTQRARPDRAHAHLIELTYVLAPIEPKARKRHRSGLRR